MKIFLINFCFIVIFPFQIFASENFLPEIQEQRAQRLFLQVKCLVCEGQVIENSNTQIALQMRKLIREKIIQGLSDQEIKDFLVKNYGDEILTSPPINHNSWLLWFLPLIAFVIFIIILVKKFKCKT